MSWDRWFLTTCNNFSPILHIHSQIPLQKLIHSYLLLPRYASLWRHDILSHFQHWRVSCAKHERKRKNFSSPLERQIVSLWSRQHSTALRQSFWRVVAPWKGHFYWSFLLNNTPPTYILKSIVSRLWAPEFFARRFTIKTVKIILNFNISHSVIALFRRFDTKFQDISSLTTLKLK